MRICLIAKMIVLLFSVSTYMCVYAVSDSGEKPVIEMAITFDDLPAVTYEDKPDKKFLENKIESKTEIIQMIIDTLKEHNIPHVYGFMNGFSTKNMQERLHILDLWKKGGHLLGNHTFSHYDFLDVSAEKFIQDIEDNESFLIDYADSIEELKYLRFPFLQEGDTKEKRYAVRNYLFKRKYKIAPVTVDFEDWTFGPNYEHCVYRRNILGMRKLEKIYMEQAKKRLLHADKLARYMYGKPKKQILLLHVNLITARMLDKLIKEYKQLGVKFISFKEALSDPIYDIDPAVWFPVGKSFLLQTQESRKIQTPPDIRIAPIPRDTIHAICK